MSPLTPTSVLMNTVLKRRGGSLKFFDGIVDTSGTADFETIQDAIDSLGSNSIILVKKGTYGYKFSSNLVSDSEMNVSGTSNWPNWSVPTTNERTTEQVFDGAYARKISANAGSNGIQSSPQFTDINGRKLDVQLRVFPVATTSIQSGINNTDKTVTNPITGLTADDWNLVTYTAKATAAAANFYISILTNSFPQTFYVDDVLVRHKRYCTIDSSLSNIKIICEPGTIIQGQVVIEGSNNSIVFGSGSDVQDTIIVTGNDNSLIFRNGVSYDGLINSADRLYVNGMGWGTFIDGGAISEALLNSGDDFIIENCRLNTNSGTAGKDCISANGNRNLFVNNKILDSDDQGFEINCIDSCVIGNVGIDSDGHFIRSSSAQCLVVGNNAIGGANDGVNVTATGDNNLVNANILKPSTDPIGINAGGTGIVANGNRLNGAAVDSGSGNVLANNDETAF